jgi:hypothetical protein
MSSDMASGAVTAAVALAVLMGASNIEAQARRAGPDGALISASDQNENPIEEGRRLADKIFSSWKACLVEATDSYARSNERAETVADVALNKCSEWDVAVKKTLSHLIAVDLRTKMPFDEALKLAEGDADNTLREAKDKMKLKLVERVMDKRLNGAGRGRKRS